MRNYFVVCMVLLLSACTKNTTISLQDAKDVAVKQYQGEVLSAALDEENERSVYHVTMNVDDTKYEITIDAENGEILADTKLEEDPNTSAETPPSSTISEEKAKEIALAKSGGGEIIKVEFDKADDPMEVDTYDIKIQDENKEYEMEIHAETGEILKYEEENLHK